MGNLFVEKIQRPHKYVNFMRVVCHALLLSVTVYVIGSQCTMVCLLGSCSASQED